MFKFLVFIFSSVLIIFYLNNNFGIFSRDLDKLDKANWVYKDNRVVGAESFILNGKKNICFLLIHGYSSSPKEFLFLKDKLKGQYTKAILLKGHGALPSELIGLSLNDWYQQAEKEFNSLNKDCSKINIVGSSFGSILALALAERNYENKKLNKIFILNPYFESPSKLKNFVIKNFSSILFSLKIDKNDFTINDYETSNKFFRYLSFYLIPIKDSLEFIKTVSEKENIKKIKAQVFWAHSVIDPTASFNKTVEVLAPIPDNRKESLILYKSSHILLFDLEREEIINKIIDF